MFDHVTRVLDYSRHPANLERQSTRHEVYKVVAQLVEALNATQQNVSKHLGVLHEAGIIGRTKEGTSVRYAIADDTVFALCELVCGGLREQLTELDGILSGGSAASCGDSSWNTTPPSTRMLDSAARPSRTVAPSFSTMPEMS